MITEIRYCRIKWKDDDSMSFAYPVAIGTDDGVTEELDSQVGYYAKDEAEFEALKGNDPNCDFIVLEVEEVTNVTSTCVNWRKVGSDAKDEAECDAPKDNEPNGDYILIAEEVSKANSSCLKWRKW